jgi:2,3-bisphosphoglycerate-independent phosphoglycerate mutase
MQHASSKSSGHGKGKKKTVAGPVIALIWDGFGYYARKEGNAIANAKMPTYNRLWKHNPHALLVADGEAVGLPKDQVGNSEAGHMTIGAGRRVETDVLRINREIKKNTFRDNPALLRAIAHVTRNNSTLHLMGLLTNRSSGHSFPDHVYALLRFVEELHLPRVVIHPFTDGRDTPPYHAVQLIQELQKRLPKNVAIGSIIGRFYAMDRNRFWDRTQKAYEALIGYKASYHGRDPIDAIEKAYARGESDEFIQPTYICPNKTCLRRIENNDAIIFWNLRSDRARQLIKPFVMPDFEQKEKGAFRRKMKRKNLFFVTLTEFGSDIEGVVPAYANRDIHNTLVEALNGRRQTYIAESEKYVHVTYFLNGGHDQARFNEKRINIPTYRVERYDEKPRMRAIEIARAISKAIKGGSEFVCANFANADMVGHTGNLEATVKACEALDEALDHVLTCAKKCRATVIILSDHGNAELIIREDGTPDTEHNPNPVPFIIDGHIPPGLKIHPKGELADVAPTILALLGIPQPKEMTGHSLITRSK